MMLPPGCGSMSGKVVRLNKSLYGLKQASRTFYKRLVSDLKRIGFEQSLSDPCVLRFMMGCLLYTSPSPRDRQKSRMPSSA